MADDRHQLGFVVEDIGVLGSNTTVPPGSRTASGNLRKPHMGPLARRTPQNSRPCRRSSPAAAPVPQLHTGERRPCPCSSARLSASFSEWKLVIRPSMVSCGVAPLGTTPLTSRRSHLSAAPLCSRHTAQSSYPPLPPSGVVNVTLTLGHMRRKKRTTPDLVMPNPVPPFCRNNAPV